MEEKIIMEKEINISIPEGYEIDKEKSTFTKIVFKKIESKLPMSFEEMPICDNWYIYNNIISCNNHKGMNYTGKSYSMPIYPTKEYAEAFWALSKLIWLRDAWNEGWKAEFTDDTLKHVLFNFENKLRCESYRQTNYIMAFKTKDIRDKFFIQFRDLLEIAIPLL